MSTNYYLAHAITSPHVRIGVEPLGDCLIGNAENPVHNMDDAVDGADVLLHHGGVHTAPLHSHQLVSLRVVKPNSICGERSGRRESLQHSVFYHVTGSLCGRGQV